MTLAKDQSMVVRRFAEQPASWSTVGDRLPAHGQRSLSHSPSRHDRPKSCRPEPRARLSFKRDATIQPTES